MNQRKFFAELKRRNVYKVAVAYIVGGWALSQGIAQVFPVFDVPNWIIRAIVILIIAGLPVALVLAWMFEITSEGIKRTEDLDLATAARVPKKYVWLYVVAIGAAVSIGLFFLGRYTAESKNSAAAFGDTLAKSIAVLPFVNMSADKADEYLSDGMTEELLNVLSKVKGLRVPGRSSSFAFKGKNEEDIFRKVGEKLHVNSVLEGSVRKVGDKLRITAQLINVANGYHLWSETYDRDVKDILAVESEVARRVVDVLKVQLGVEEARALTKKVTENPEAHPLYLLGRYHSAKYTQTDMTEAVRYYEQALQLDPGFALAYCGLADNYGLQGGNSMPGREAWAKGKELAQKALQLDPNLAEAHLSLGIAHAAAFEWTDAENELKRALDLNPNLALAYDATAWVLAASGRVDEAIAKEKHGLELDPLNPFLNEGLGWFLYWGRRYDDAIWQLRSSIELFPSDAFSHFVLGWCLIKKGNVPEAKAEFEKATKLDDLPWYFGALGYANVITGDHAEAEQILHNLNELAKRRYVTPGARVPVYLGLGENEKALDWLEKCYQDQDSACWWIKVDQLYDCVRNEPRFQALLKKVGLDR
jgi:adenylate cyclase